MEFKGSNAIRFFLLPRFANRGLRSSCSEPAGASCDSVTDGWKVWAEYWEQNHIRAATPNKTAVAHTSANGRPTKWGHRPI